MDWNGIYSIIEKSDNGSFWSKTYDLFMLAVILLSLIPLTIHTGGQFFVAADIFTCTVFTIDYILRWVTADIRSGNKGLKAFLLSPFTPMAVIDLLSILPTLSLISPAFKVLRTSRLFKILRIFKFLRYYEPLQIMVTVIKKQGKTLLTVLFLV